MQTAVEMTPARVTGEIAPVPVASQIAESSRDLTDQTATVTLSPAEWARQVLGITAPFGHDHLPTVWG